MKTREQRRAEAFATPQCSLCNNRALHVKSDPDRLCGGCRERIDEAARQRIEEDRRESDIDDMLEWFRSARDNNRLP
jgi:hypothetical protein